MQRLGAVLRVKPEFLPEYKRYHAAVWPDLLKVISDSNIKNYSIFLKDDLLFGYMEYHGADLRADLARMAESPRMQEWWAIMEPMQEPLPTRAPGEWWAAMEEVFHTE